MDNLLCKNSENPLSKKFTMGSLLKFALPTIVMMIFMGVYTIGDTIIISRFINTNALSSLNIITPIINVIVGLGAMLATGGNAIVAKKLGEGNKKRASQDFTLMVLAGAIFGGLIALLGILFIDEIIWALGANELLFSDCKKYLFILLLFTPASMMQVYFQSLMVTAGKPGLGMVLSIGAGIINIILDYVFVVSLKMGIAGSALGTGIGYLIPSLIGIFFFANRKRVLHFQKPILDFHVLWKSSSNGFSEMISQIATAVITFLFNIMMMKMVGENGVAALTIIIYAQFLLTAMYIGFSMGVAPIISYNYGSKDFENLKIVFKISLLFITVMSIIVFCFSILFSSPLVSIFAEKGSTVNAIARQGFLIFPISFLFCGFNIFASATFTALSNGKISAIISVLRTFFFILIALLIFPQLLGVTGIWIAVPIAEFLTLFVSIALIRKNKRIYHYL